METEKLIDYIVRIVLVPGVAWAVWVTKMIFNHKENHAIGSTVSDNILEKLSEVISRLDKIDERLRDLEIKRK